MFWPGTVRFGSSRTRCPCQPGEPLDPELAAKSSRRMLTERVNHAYPSFLVPADVHYGNARITGSFERVLEQLQPRRSSGRREQAGARAVARPDSEGPCEKAGRETQVSEVSRRLGQPLLQKVVQVACQKTWMERLGDLRFTWFLPIRRLQ